MEFLLLQEVDVYHICHFRGKISPYIAFKSSTDSLSMDSSEYTNSQFQPGQLLFVQNRNWRHVVWCLSCSLKWTTVTTVYIFKVCGLATFRPKKGDRQMEWMFSLFSFFCFGFTLVRVLPAHDYCTHANRHRRGGFWVLTIWGWTQQQQQSCKEAVTDN